MGVGLQAWKGVGLRVWILGEEGGRHWVVEVSCDLGAESGVGVGLGLKQGMGLCPCGGERLSKLGTSDESAPNYIQQTLPQLYGPLIIRTPFNFMRLLFLTQTIFSNFCLLHSVLAIWHSLLILY